MGTTAETLDLSRIAAPSLLTLDAMALRAAMLVRFVAIWEEKRALDPTLPSYDVSTIEADPAVVTTEEFVFFDTLLRGLVNDLAKSLRLVSATGPDLDHLATTYMETPRLVLAAATETTAEVLEQDEPYRARAQLSSESLAEFGVTPGGYVHRITSLYGDRVLDAAPVRTGGGGIDLVVLGRTGDGTPDETLIGDIAAAFAAEDASQSTDIVTVRPAEIRATQVRIILGIRRGPDPEALKAAARKAVAALAEARHRIGEVLHVQALGAVARIEPARWARVVSPSADIVGGDYGAPFVSSIEIETEIDE